MSSKPHVSLAWPLALGMTLLIAYASLYPFVGWRSQGVPPWVFLWAPWPKYWTWFDVQSNFVGYMPLGLLLALAAARTGWRRWAWCLGAVLPSVLSLSLETLQSYLPGRVPSTVDWLLNSAGALVGAGLGLLMLRWRLLGSWTHFRHQWLVPDTHGGLVVLLLWPLATLYPSSVPFGLGHVAQRAEAALTALLEDTPFLPWLPEVSASLPLSPLGESLVVALCLWAPLLLGYAILHKKAQRLAWLFAWAGVVWVVGGLSAALTWGPVHAWAWLTPPVLVGLVCSLILGALALPLAHRACAVLMLLTLGYALGLLNRAPETPYFAQSLAIWEQGRFIRFHGLSQWLGWLWPFAALWVGMQLALRRGGSTIPPHE